MSSEIAVKGLNDLLDFRLELRLFKRKNLCYTMLYNKYIFVRFAIN